MKKSILILIAMSVLIIACSTDPNKKVKKVFKEYVEVSFDNPKDLESIVMIDSPKFYSIDSLFADAEKYVQLYQETCNIVDSLDSAIVAELEYMIDHQPKLVRYIQSHHHDKYVKTLLNNMENRVTSQLETYAIGKNPASQEIIKILEDTTQQYNTYSKQTIKYRVYKEGTLHLDSVFYIIKNDTIQYISESEITPKDFGGNADKLAELLSNDLLLETKEVLNQLHLLKEAEVALTIIKSRI